MISHESWKSEIEKAMFRAGDEGMTTREISVLLGLSTKSTLLRVRELYESGRVVSGRRRSKSMDGRIAWVPVYRIK